MDESTANPDGYGSLHFSNFVSFSDGELIFNHENISEVFSNPELQSMPVALIGVIGEGAQTANYPLTSSFVKFIAQENGIDTLNVNYSNSDESHGIENGPSRIISTTHPMLVRYDGDQNLALFILETRGCCSSGVDFTNNFTKLSGILAHISSHVICLTLGSIQDEDLSWLVDLRQKNIMIEQLTILVQNWDKPKEFLFGPKGGQNYINHILKSQPETSAMLLLKKHVKQVNCFLMPSEDGPDFQSNWTQFLTRIVGRLYLSPKEIEGQIGLGVNMPHLIESYISIGNHEVFMDTSTAEAGGEHFEEMEVDPPSSSLILETNLELEKISKELIPVQFSTKSEKLSLEEYLSQLEISKKNKPTLKGADPILNLISENQKKLSPQEILSKHYKEPVTSSLSSLPESHNIDAVAQTTEFENVHEFYFISADGRYVNIDPICEPDNQPDIVQQKIQAKAEISIADSESGCSSEFDYSEERPEVDRLNFEKRLRQNIRNMFKEIPISGKNDQLEETTFQRALHLTLRECSIPENQINSSVQMSDLKASLDYYFHVLHQYDGTLVQHLESSPGITSTRLHEVFNEFKQELLSVKPPNDHDEQMKKILINKFEEKLQMTLEQLKSQENALQFSIQLALAYYQQEFVRNSTHNFEAIQTKILDMFLKIAEPHFQNQAWKDFHINEFQKQLLQVCRTQTPTLAKISQHENKPLETETNISYSESMTYWTHYYQKEMTREMQFGRVKQLSQLQEVHKMAENRTIQKFKSQMGELNCMPEWMELNLTQLTTRINEEYKSYHTILNMKLAEETSRLELSVVSKPRVIAPPLSNNLNMACTDYDSKSSLPTLSKNGYVGIHACHFFIAGGIPSKEGIKFYKTARANENSPSEIHILVKKFKTDVEKIFQNSFDRCIIAVPVSSTPDEKDRLSKAVKNEGFQIVEIISENCALAFWYLKNCKVTRGTGKLIVLLCNNDEGWSAGAYRLDKDIIRAIAQDAGEIKTDMKHSRAREIIKSVKNKANFKTYYHILLAGPTHAVESLKSDFIRQGDYISNRIHACKVESILQGTILYAKERFDDASGPHISIQTDHLNSITHYEAAEKKRFCYLL